MNLVFDIGGTYMRLAVADADAIVSEPLTINTPKSYNDAVSEFGRLARQLSGGSPFGACAGGVPGVLDPAKTRLIDATNLPDWVNKPLQQDLQQILSCPVILANDTAIGALGEAYYGAGKDSRIVAYLAIGTGVGGCRLVNRVMDENAQGFEPGAQLISQSGRQAWSLEELVSGAALHKKYGLPPGAKVTDPKVIDELAWNLSIGIHNLIYIWSPDMVVLGGGIINSGVIPLQTVNIYLLQLIDKFPVMPSVVVSQLKDKSGLLGAITLLRH